MCVCVYVQLWTHERTADTLAHKFALLRAVRPSVHYPLYHLDEFRAVDVLPACSVDNEHVRALLHEIVYEDIASWIKNERARKDPPSGHSSDEEDLQHPSPTRAARARPTALSVSPPPTYGSAAAGCSSVGRSVQELGEQESRFRKRAAAVAAEEAEAEAEAEEIENADDAAEAALAKKKVRPSSS